MGREKRAKSLVPSFVLVASAAAVACDDSHIIVNPPPPFFSSYDGGGSSNGGYGNAAAGYTTILPTPACPAVVPGNGSPCMSPSEGTRNECEYDRRDRCVMARCVGGIWSVEDCDSDPGAGGDSAGGAPTAEGGAAGDGAGGAASAEGGAAGDGPAPDPVVYCPQALPVQGASCFKPSSVTSFRCDYAQACGSYEATCNGQWQLTFHDPSASSCAGGASND